MRLILASTSVYRRELLARLRMAFDVERPDVDETPAANEQPPALATRLADAKAAAIAARHADAWVIGSDQVAELNGVALGKPGGRDAAIVQLQRMAGMTVHFHTAVCMRHGDGRAFAAIDRTSVQFRRLGAAEIIRYVDAEQPYDCAGSFKCEGLGITLFEAIDTSDPTALVGLPLIATSALLRRAGWQVP